MARTFMRPGQMSGSATFNDSATVGSSMEDNGGLRTLDDDLNNLRSIIKNLAGETNWYDDVTAVGGVQRNHAQLHTHLDSLMSGSHPVAALLVDGRVQVNDTTDATSTTDGALQTDGGLSVALDAVVGDDLSLLSDAAVLNFGADKDVSLTHVADTGLLVNGAMEIQFRDSALSVGSTADGQLDVEADSVAKVTAPTAELEASTEVLLDTPKVHIEDDSAVLAFGADEDVTFTHDGSTGLDVASAGAFDVSAGAASQIATSAGDLTVDATAGSLNLTGGEEDAAAVRIHADHAGGGIDVDAGTAGIAIDSTGAISLDAAAASNLTTSAGALTLQGASGASLSASGGDVTVEGTTFSGNDVTIPGDLTVQGTTTTLETTNATVKDSLIALGSSSAGIDTNADRGLLLPRTADVSKAFFWDHSDSTFALVDTWSSGSDTAVVIDAYQDLKVKDITFSGLTENQIAYPDANGKLEGSANFTFDDSDLQLADNIGLVFSTDDAEKIESDGTDLTVNSGGDINLTATSDVNVPANVGMTFGDDGEKIEGDGTDLTISTSNDLNLTVTNDFDVDASNAIQLDAAAASNLTVTGGDLVLSTATSGELDLTSADLMDINAGNNLDIDVAGDYTLDATGTMSLDGIGASNVTTDSGNLTLSATTSGNVVVQAAGGSVDIDADSGELSLDGSTGINIGTEADVAIDMDADTLDIDASGAITIDSTSIFSIDGVGTSNVTTNGDLTVSGSLSLALQADDGAVTIASRLGDVDVDAGGYLVLDGASGINIGTAADVAFDWNTSTLDFDASGQVDMSVEGADFNLETSTSGGITIAAADTASFSGATTQISNGSGGLFFNGMESMMAGLIDGVRFASGSADVTTFLSNFGEGDQDLLGAINKVYDLASGGNISKSVYVATGSIAADTPIEGIALSSSAWDANDINVHLNGVLQRSGSQGDHDVYRDSSNNLKFNYALEDGDFIVVQSFGS